MSERRSNAAMGQHTDRVRAEDNGQARPGSPGRRTAGNSDANVGQLSGGEEHSGLGRANRGSVSADISTQQPVK